MAIRRSASTLVADRWECINAIASSRHQKEDISELLAKGSSVRSAGLDHLPQYPVGVLERRTAAVSPMCLMLRSARMSARRVLSAFQE